VVLRDRVRVVKGTASNLVRAVGSDKVNAWRF
jgi:hypothetical protein